VLGWPTGWRGPALVTAADMVAGHVALDLLPGPAVPQWLREQAADAWRGGVLFHDHRGSRSCRRPVRADGEKFRRDIRGWAQAGGFPVIVFRAGERKAEVIAP
jgi:hypothetical protein